MTQYGFKGPLSSSSHNIYKLTIVDEYSCFFFTYPCPNVSSTTVMKCLDQLFTLWLSESHIHSDHGASFSITRTEKLSHTTESLPERQQFNTQQVMVNLHCNLQNSQRKLVLPDALHSIRLLLFTTSVNSTPYERLFGFQCC